MLLAGTHLPHSILLALSTSLYIQLQPVKSPFQRQGHTVDRNGCQDEDLKGPQVCEQQQLPAREAGLAEDEQGALA
eukprot:1157428-Pelagomonas_calceolata.AAC.3